MHLCFRVDLDYVPWNMPPAGELPHSEPAMFIRLIDVARSLGPRIHFFASAPVIRAFPVMISTLLEEGHDLDWLCREPENAESQFADVRGLTAQWGHEFRGVGASGQWPQAASIPPDLRFVSAKAGPVPAAVRLFPVSRCLDAELIKSAGTAAQLEEDLRTHLRDLASRRAAATLAVSLPVLATIDRQLHFVRRLIEFTESIGMPVRTLRQVEKDSGPHSFRL